MEHQWITNRLPTEADGDADGDVRLRRGQGYGLAGVIGLVHWSYVGLGAPWQHTSYWKPSAEPETTEPDRIAALEQRVAEGFATLEQLFWDHNHKAIEPIEVPAPCLKSLTDDQLLTHHVAVQTKTMRRAVERCIVEAKRPGGLLP